MITTFTNRTGTDACPSVPTTRRRPRRIRRAALGVCPAAPGRRTARRCPRRPAATSWSARRRTGRSAACPSRPLSTTAACSTITYSTSTSTTTGCRPETRHGIRSPACRAPQSLRRRRRRRPSCRQRRHWTCSTRSSSTSSGGRWRQSPKTVSVPPWRYNVFYYNCISKKRIVPVWVKAPGGR